MALKNINNSSTRVVACVQTSPPPSGKNRERSRYRVVYVNSSISLQERSDINQGLQF